MIITLNGKKIQIRELEIDADGISHIKLEDYSQIVITELLSIEINAELHELKDKRRLALSLAQLTATIDGREKAMDWLLSLPQE